jgi:hypothetical protein
LIVPDNPRSESNMLEEIREFAHLPFAQQLASLRSIPGLLSPEGLTYLNPLRNSPRLIYGVAQVLSVERALGTAGLAYPLVEIAAEIAPDFERLNRLIQEETRTGYSPGVALNNGHLLLYSLVRASAPTLVVETGVASGVSSYFILSAMDRNGAGTLISVDLPNLENSAGYVNRDGALDRVFTPPQKGVGWVVPASKRGRWRLLQGRSMDILPTIHERVSLFLHDSDHSYSNMTEEFEWARDSGATIILSDDIGWNSAWRDFTARHKVFHVESGNLGIAIRMGCQRAEP